LPSFSSCFSGTPAATRKRTGNLKTEVLENGIGNVKMARRGKLGEFINVKPAQ